MGVDDIIVERDHRLIVKSSRELAKKIKGLVSKDTFIVYLDESARLARVPLERALLEEKVVLPRKRYFLNFSLKDATQYKAEDKVPSLLLRSIGKKMASFNLRGVRNVLIVDECTSGHSLSLLKDAFQKATGKPVSTVGLSFQDNSRVKQVGRSIRPDFFSSSNVGEEMFLSAEKPVRTTGRAVVRKSVKRKSGVVPYGKYNARIIKEFERTRPQSVRARRR